MPKCFYYSSGSERLLQRTGGSAANPAMGRANLAVGARKQRRVGSRRGRARLQCDAGRWGRTRIRQGGVGVNLAAGTATKAAAASAAGASAWCRAHRAAAFASAVRERVRKRQQGGCKHNRGGCEHSAAAGVKTAGLQGARGHLHRRHESKGAGALVFGLGGGSHRRECGGGCAFALALVGTVVCISCGELERCGGGAQDPILASFRRSRRYSVSSRWNRGGVRELEVDEKTVLVKKRGTGQRTGGPNHTLEARTIPAIPPQCPAAASSMTVALFGVEDFCTAAHFSQASFSQQGIAAPTPMLTILNNPTAVTSKACAAKFRAASEATAKFTPAAISKPPTPTKAPTSTVAVRTQLRHATYCCHNQPSPPTPAAHKLHACKPSPCQEHHNGIFWFNGFNYTCHQSNRPRLQGCIPTAAGWCRTRMKSAAAPPH
ncbi:hypothetical protein B0H19DRAFT_1056982 [Mycena capillaripes]|nr:hypothetical protein B0H19DRAFT_1056982 [Mycena capillaripes]